MTISTAKIEQAINLAVGCIIASGIPMKDKVDVIGTLRKLEEMVVGKEDA